jgi:acid phosphatase
MRAAPDQWAQQYPLAEIEFPEAPPGPSLDVLVLGDWGKGGPGQRALARTIAETHGASPPRLVITVGDNVYENGVTSVDDPLWAKVFTQVYTGPFWEAMEFRPALGNHDYRGDPDAQVAFSERDPRWRMPARHYGFHLEVPGGGTARFLALDTNLGGLTPEETAEQAAWLEGALGTGEGGGWESRPDWIVTYGHYPLAGGGPREPDAGVLEAFGGPIAEASDLYLAGHEHITQLVRSDPLPLHGICGGGSGTDDPYRLDPDTPGELAGFTGGGWCLVRLWETQGAVELYDALGRLQYRELFEPRR